MSEQSLWIDSQRQRFFLIPFDQELPAGPIRILSLVSEERFVDASVLDPFEVSSSDVDRYLNLQTDQIRDQVSALLKNPEALARVFSASPASPEVLEMVSELLQIPKENLDPETIAIQKQTLLNTLRERLRENTAEDPQNILDPLQIYLKQQGITLDLSLPELPTEGESFDEEALLAQWKPLLLVLQNALITDPELQDLLQKAVPKQPQTPPVVTEEYRQVARAALADARQALKVPKLDFKTLSQPNLE